MDEFFSHQFDCIETVKREFKEALMEAKKATEEAIEFFKDLSTRPAAREGDSVRGIGFAARRAGVILTDKENTNDQ